MTPNTRPDDNESNLQMLRDTLYMRCPPSTDPVMDHTLLQDEVEVEYSLLPPRSRAGNVCALELVVCTLVGRNRVTIKNACYLGANLVDWS